MITTPINFSEDIERLTKNTGVEYIDAVLHWCARNNIEVEVAASLIKKDQALKAKLTVEAENLNILKRGARLPI